MRRLALLGVVLPVVACDGFTLPPLPGCEDCCGTRIGGYTSRLWQMGADLSVAERLSFHGERTLNSAAFGDVDGDGARDAVFGSFAFDGLALLRDIEAGTGSLEELPEANDVGEAPALWLVDMDADGDLDVLAAHMEGTHLTMSRNDGRGGLGELEVLDEEAGRAVVAELDGEDPTEVIAIGRDGMRVLQGSASGDLEGAVPRDPVPIDLDADGDLDLAALDMPEDGVGTVVAWLNDGAGGLTRAEIEYPHPDGTLASMNAGAAEIALHDATTFQALPFEGLAVGAPRTLGTLPDGAACFYNCDPLLADADGDGRIDAIVEASDRSLFVLSDDSATELGAAGNPVRDDAGGLWALDAPERCVGEGL